MYILCMPTFRKRFKKSLQKYIFYYVIASPLSHLFLVFQRECSNINCIVNPCIVWKSICCTTYISFSYGLCKDQEFLEDCTSTILFKVHLAQNSTMQGLVNRYLMYHFAICTQYLLSTLGSQQLIHTEQSTHTIPMFVS